jgi:integrase
VVARRYYRSWRVGGRRVKRRIGLKRTPSCADGLTHVQAEAALRRLMAAMLAPPSERYTVAEAGAIYIEHLEYVIERKHSTIADYRGYLNQHLGPFFGAGQWTESTARASRSTW